MKIHKDINDIKFTRRNKNSEGEGLEVSEPIVMASAAGWYVGAVYKEPECDGMIAPYRRDTHYVATPEEAVELLKAFEKDETPEPTGPWATQDDYI